MPDKNPTDEINLIESKRSESHKRAERRKRQRQRAIESNDSPMIKRIAHRSTVKTARRKAAKKNRAQLAHNTASIEAIRQRSTKKTATRKAKKRLKQILSNDVDSAKASSSKRTNKRKKQRKALLTIEDIRANHLRRRLSRKTERRRSKKVPTAGTQPKTISVIKKTYQRKRKLAKDGNVEVAKRKRKSNVTCRSKPFTTRNL